jgi:hypothetical protein
MLAAENGSCATSHAGRRRKKRSKHCANAGRPRRQAPSSTDAVGQHFPVSQRWTMLLR